MRKGARGKENGRHGRDGMLAMNLRIIKEADNYIAEIRCMGREYRATRHDIHEAAWAAFRQAGAFGSHFPSLQFAAAVNALQTNCMTCHHRNGSGIVGPGWCEKHDFDLSDIPPLVFEKGWFCCSEWITNLSEKQQDMSGAELMEAERVSFCEACASGGPDSPQCEPPDRFPDCRWALARIKEHCRECQKIMDLPDLSCMAICEHFITAKNLIVADHDWHPDIYD